MKALIVSWAQCTLLKVNIQSYASLSVVTFWPLKCWKNPVWFQRKAAIESWLDLKEDFHSLEAHSVSRCSMSDKETKALKYTLTGIPDALSSWRIKEKGKKKKSDHPPTLPWGQQCKPRHPHLGFSTFGAHSQGRWLSHQRWGQTHNITDTLLYGFQRSVVEPPSLQSST